MSATICKHNYAAIEAAVLEVLHDWHGDERWKGYSLLFTDVSEIMDKRRQGIHQRPSMWALKRTVSSMKGRGLICQSHTINMETGRIDGSMIWLTTDGMIRAERGGK